MLKVGARCWYDLSLTPFGIYKIVLDSRSDEQTAYFRCITKDGYIGLIALPRDVTYMQARRLGLKKLQDIEQGYDCFIKRINKD